MKTNKKTSAGFEGRENIKLNHNCHICHKEIYIGKGTIIEGRPLHFECFSERSYELGLAEGKSIQRTKDFTKYYMARKEGETIMLEKIKKIIDELERKSKSVETDIGEYEKFISTHDLKEEISKLSEEKT